MQHRLPGSYRLRSNVSRHLRSHELWSHEMKPLVVTACAAMLLTACASERVDTRTLDQLSGAELYQRLCTSCHGVQARGDGPVAPLVKIGVPDLTRLALRDGGEVPRSEERRVGKECRSRWSP